MSELEETTNPRREFLTRAAVAGLGVAAMGLALSAHAATMPDQPQADTGHNYPMSHPTAMTEKQFRMGVMPIAIISRKISGMAVDKATDPKVKEFANFELREANGIIKVLTEMGTPVPPMDATGKAIVEKNEAAEGDEFDKTYTKAQLGAHEYLRDLATTYLANSEGHVSMAETHGRHMAMLTLVLFKEHVVLCKDNMDALGA